MSDRQNGDMRQKR